MRPLRCLRAAAAAGLVVALVACGEAESERLPDPPTDLQRLDRAVRADFEERLAAAREALADRHRERSLRAAAVGRLAAWYHLYGLEAAAEKTYLLARDLDPRDPRWTYHLARLYREGMRTDEARNAVREVLSVRGDYGPAHVLLGDIENEAGRPTAAGAAWRRALELTPDDPRALAGLGGLALANGDVDEALRLLERAHDLQPDATRPLYLLGRALAAAGEQERAAELLTTLPTDSEKQVPLRSVDPWVDDLATVRGGVTDHLARAKTERARGRPGAAMRHLRAAIAADEDNLAARLELAQTLAQSHHLQAAIREAEAATRNFPESPAGYRHLGTILARGGHLSEAEGQLRRSLEIDAGDAGTHFDLAQTLRAQGRLDAALEAYEEAARLDPSAAEAPFWLGVTLILRGDAAASRTIVEAAVRQLPDERRLGLLLARIHACDSSQDAAGPEPKMPAGAADTAAIDVFTAETRAMVLADAGRFIEAAAWEDAVLATLAQAATPRFNIQIARQRRDRYAAGSACDVAWLPSETVSELVVSPPKPDRAR